MNVNRINVKKCKYCLLKFELGIQTYVEFMNDFTSFQYVNCVWRSVRQVNLSTPAKDAPACLVSGSDSLLEIL